MCKFLSGQNMGPRKKRRFFNSIIFTYNRLVKLNHISIFKLFCIKPHIIVTRYSILYNVIYKVQFIQGIGYTRYSIYKVQCIIQGIVYKKVQRIQGIVYTRYSIYKVQFIQGIVYTRYSLYKIQYIQGIVYTRYNIHKVQYIQGIVCSMYCIYKVQYIIQGIV